MSIFSIIKSRWQNDINSDAKNLNQPLSVKGLTGKEMQLKFIKEYLKPLLKQQGYLTKGQTWWRGNDDFFTIINLQNFSWNLQDDVSFCFNIGVGLKATMKNPKASPNIHDLTVGLRQGAYLTKAKEFNKHRNQTGYSVKTGDEFVEFVSIITADFEHDILPKLSDLKTLKDCVDYYEGTPFWGDNLKRVLIENNIPVLK
ncbi:DUF4304 domain-containing protein [Mucilaginibacter flavidus]|uniref:DUF4304 domain-containing protein n=1 Tax=Mucilaginibacter flavidus TaxID=2949309 RepID=UPI002092F3C7|nr:DUF4304 domain-containing protein [Mucilaginibacter flavidus]MCO5950650.1 DUF4304 domain-containing protein [Mucilaginibacter flavidus]